MPDQPAVNISRATLWLIIANVAVHAIRIVLPVETGDQLTVTLGFAPSSFVAPGYGVYAPDFAVAWVSPLSYMFLHADVVHLLMNMLFLAAVGTAVERRLGWQRFIAFYLATGVAALLGTALMYWFALEIVILIGASGAVSGLFGGVARFYFQSRGPGPLNKRFAGLQLVGAFIAINLLFGLLGIDTFGGVRAVAWEAHIAGLIAGYLLFPLFDRPRRLNAIG